MTTKTYPLWTQDQAIAYEAALEAINDVIAGYSEQINFESQRTIPDQARIDWLELRTTQARRVAQSFAVTDDATVAQALMEYSAIVRERDSREATL
ncbi:hypothetical protein [Sphingobium yanoikuyae]|jgi:hypothetical protein|uniref:hypothetical protein n=1 Tax=Sphingobium yanoikuyae TaxID=13690 RepID=UPI0019D1D484|nr:hypothetical protein [Sphingobium yanoikuyae]